MLFHVFSLSQKIGARNGKRMGKRKGQAKGKGTPDEQKIRNKAKKDKPRVQCPNFDICECDSSYGAASKKFKKHFLDASDTRKYPKFKGCLAALDALTPAEKATQKWHSFEKYHPDFHPDFVAKV